MYMYIVIDEWVWEDGGFWDTRYLRHLPRGSIAIIIFIAQCGKFLTFTLGSVLARISSGGTK